MKAQKEIDEIVRKKELAIVRIMRLNNIEYSYLTGGALMNVAIKILLSHSNEQEVIRILEAHAKIIREQT